MIIEQNLGVDPALVSAKETALLELEHDGLLISTFQPGVLMSRITRYSTIVQDKVLEHALKVDRCLQSGSALYYVDPQTVKVSIVIHKSVFPQGFNDRYFFNLTFQDLFNNEGFNLSTHPDYTFTSSGKTILNIHRYEDPLNNMLLLTAMFCFSGNATIADELLDRQAGTVEGEEIYDIRDILRFGLNDIGAGVIPAGPFKNKVRDKILEIFEFDTTTPDPTTEYEALTQKYLQLYNSDQWIRYGKLD